MKNLLFIVIVLCSFDLNAQLTFDDVTLPASITKESQQLVLNGGGLREKFFLDLYVAGLYLKNKSSDASHVMAADKPMAIRLHIKSSLISSEKMMGAVDEGMERSTKGQTTTFSSEIQQFKDAFKEEIRIGDIYDIIYIPQRGLVLHKNEKELRDIKGLKFKQAVFGMWLCDEPISEDLKSAMLGN